ncbi:MAG: hypothetical protein WBA97_20220 [Actinophytocola sp.]|uniref:hypothetical protein n=1 Tax=Actinophytocola sp. TaxID=1872138 RepID=UPI003C770368
MTDDDVRPARLPITVRVAIGIVVAGMTLVVVGLLVFPSLVFPEDRSTGKSVVATESSAQVLAERLRYSMTDQDITDEVAKQRGSTVVELRHEPDVTTVLVSIPASVVEPTTHACYRFSLRQRHDVAYEKATGCPDVPTP